MKLSERITGAQAELNRMRDKLTALVEKDDISDDDQAQIEELNTRIPEAVQAIERMQSTERALAITVVERDPGDGNGDDDRQQIVDPRRPFSVPRKKVEPSDFLVRMGVIHALAHVQRKSLDDVCRRAYGDEATMMVLRAITNPATTDGIGWAQELVQVAVGEFIDKLMPLAIYPRIASRGPRFTFDRYGIIKFPARSDTPTINGSFVGEGQPIPVRKAGLTSITLTPKKLGVISTFTREIAQHSIPSIEQIIRQAMAEDTSVAVDTVLIDALPANAIRPAGLRNGVVGLTPAAVATPPATSSIPMIADLQALIGAITAVNGGRDIVILLNPQQALAIAFAQSATGEFMFSGIDEAGRRLGVTFVSSTTVPAQMVIALDASEYTSATGDTPEYDVSDQATIHEESVEQPVPPSQAAGIVQPITQGTGIPAPVAPAIVAWPVRSLWQTASLGVRMLLDMNWAMRRQGMVSWMQGVNWPTPNP